MRNRSQVFEVEKILDKRKKGKRTEYLVQWVNFDDPRENTWEPADILREAADVAIKRFEKELIEMSPAKSASNKRRPPVKSAGNIDREVTSKRDDKHQVDDEELDDFNGFEKEEVNDEDVSISVPGTSKDPALKEKKTIMAIDDIKLKGFARGLEVEKLLGATNEPGEIIFLVKWKGCEEIDLIKAKEANVKIPEAVIKFYEERIAFVN